MPGYAYGLPAHECNVGQKLAKVKGSICSDCYALKGMYPFPSVQAAQYRRLESLGHPQWVEAMAYLMAHKGGGIKWFRWHDSGDLIDVGHLNKLMGVALLSPNTKFWLPTREVSILREFVAQGGSTPNNVTIRVSAAMVDGRPPKHFHNTSTVSSSRFSCPAPDQNNECGDCRKCWDKRVKNVSYRRH